MTCNTEKYVLLSCYPVFCVNSLIHEPSDEGSKEACLFSSKESYISKEQFRKWQRGNFTGEEPEKHYTSAR